MSKLKLNITMSLDGFVAGPDQSFAHPIGIRGQELHGWLLPLKAFRESHGEEGGEVNASTPFAEDILAGAGATIMGRNMFGGGPGIVGRVMAGLVGRRSALSSSRLRPHEPPARAARAARRNDVPFRHGRDRIGARTGTGSSRRKGGFSRGWGVGRAAIPRRGPARRDRRLDRSGPARRRRSAVRTSRRGEARAGRVGRGARRDPHPIRPGLDACDDADQCKCRQQTANDPSGGWRGS